MKTKYFIFVFIFLILGCSLIYADVPPPPDYHGVTGCTKIINLNEFPEISLIGYPTGPGGDNQAYIIDPNVCLNGGRYGILTIYAVSKDFMNGKNISTINISEPIFLTTDTSLNITQGSRPPTDPILEQNISYKIVGFLDDKIIIYESEKITRYNNGNPVKTENFNKPETPGIRNSVIKTGDIPPLPPTPEPTPTPTPQPVKPVKKTVWQNISCFFSKLFGGKC